jgi:hypothetical protein
MAEARKRRRRNVTGKPASRLPTDPTPKQIAERAAEIRSKWSEDVKRKRRGLPSAPIPYEIPVIDFLDNQYWGIRIHEDEDGEE